MWQSPGDTKPSASLQVSPRAQQSDTGLHLIKPAMLQISLILPTREAHSSFDFQGIYWGSIMQTCISHISYSASRLQRSNYDLRHAKTGIHINHIVGIDLIVKRIQSNPRCPAQNNSHQQSIPGALRLIISSLSQRPVPDTGLSLECAGSEQPKPAELTLSCTGHLLIIREYIHLVQDLQVDAQGKVVMEHLYKCHWKVILRSKDFRRKKCFWSFQAQLASSYTHQHSQLPSSSSVIS